MVSQPLSDRQLLQFLGDGFLELSPETMTESDHDRLYDRAADLYNLARVADSPTAHLDILGDNLRAAIPALAQVLSDPVVDGALTSLLGPDYLVHPHSYCHRSGPRDQIFHQDGNLPWNERGHSRSHHLDWLMLFYYPQETDETNGPTEVVAGSQYWTIDHETGDGWHPGDRVDRTVDDEVFAGADLSLRDRTQSKALDRGLGIPELDRRFLHVAKGTVLLAHYDLFHRGSRTEGNPAARYMYKFYFARTREPIGHGDTRAERPLDLSGLRPEVRPMVAANWHWLRGGVPGAIGELETDSAEPGRPGTVTQLARQLSEGREDERVAAAYRLGEAAANGDPAALQALDDALSGENESIRRNAGHGLRQAGPAGLGVLVRGAEAAAASTRRPAVAGLGTVTASHDPASVAVLIRALRGDADDLVRSNAAYSLGQLCRARELANVDEIVIALLDRLRDDVEADNAFGAGFSRSTVRQSAAFSLVPALTNHRLPDDLIDQIIDGPLQDRDRYVQGLTVEALTNSEHLSPGAHRRLARFLATRRWNPTSP